MSQPGLMLKVMVVVEVVMVVLVDEVMVVMMMVVSGGDGCGVCSVVCDVWHVLCVHQLPVRVLRHFKMAA